MPEPRHRQRIVIVGAGFAGFHAARTLSRLARHLGRQQAAGIEIVLINPTDYFLYLPLLPEVAGGVLDPRRVAVPLPDPCPGARLLVGTAEQIDLRGRRVSVAGPEGDRSIVPYDRLLLTAGSVNKLLPVPGIAQHSHGFRSIAEALYLRDHLLRQLELAASGDHAEREARCTFVVVGAGYTGTEVAAQGQLLTRAAARRHSGLRGQRLRWLLLDQAPHVLPELDRRLSAAAHRTLTRRGTEIRTGTTVTEATSGGVRLSDGQFVPTRSLIWCVGVRPDPLVAQLGLPTTNGRLNVDEFLTVPGHPDVAACGDIAAVPDLTRPGQLTPMTAQHAERQGRLAARNIAASLGYGHRRAYRHHDLGFVVDLGGAAAAANPLGVPLSGLPAKAVTRGYHLGAIPANRVRIACEWLLDAVLPRQAVQFGLVPAAAVPLGAVDANPRSGHQPAADAPSKQTAGVQRHGLRGTSVPGSAAEDSIAWAPSDAAWPGTCS
jgi:NADH:ubiquinone reductase (H+-translocating)